MAKLNNPIGVKQAVERAVNVIYNAELNESDTRAILERLAKAVNELLAMPDAGKSNRGRSIEIDITEEA